MIPQGPAMRPVFNKGLKALSVPEVGKLLSHVGLASLVPDFKQHHVGPFPCSFSFHFTPVSKIEVSPQIGCVN